MLRMHSSLRAATLTVAALLIAAPALAASPDAAFATKAAQGGVAEVRLAQLAESKSNNTAVLAFARRMIADHKKNNDQLEKIMKSEKLTVPSDPGPTSDALYKKLDGLKGPAFDQAYIKAQISAHGAMASMLQSEISSGKDAKLVGYAKQTLPAVKQHLGLAKNSLPKSKSDQPNPM